MPNEDTRVIELEVYSVTAVTSGALGLVSSTMYGAQLILTPENVWIPVGMVFGLVSLSVWSTVRAIRIFDKMNSDLKRIKRVLKLEDD